ncbi:MAG: hypothetical protein AAF335_02845, partial [Bacteroidota bacterium]
TILLPASELATIFKSDLATILKKGWKALGMSLTIGNAIFRPKELAEASKEVEKIEKLTNPRKDPAWRKKLFFRFLCVCIENGKMGDKYVFLLHGYLREICCNNLPDDIKRIVFNFLPLCFDKTIPFSSSDKDILALEKASLTNYAWLIYDGKKCLGPILFTEEKSGTAYIWEKLKKFSACYLPTFSQEELLQPLSIVKLCSKPSFHHQITNLEIRTMSYTLMFAGLHVREREEDEIDDEDDRSEPEAGLKEWFPDNISQLLRKYPRLNNYVRLQQLMHSIRLDFDFNPEYVSASRGHGLRYLTLRYDYLIDQFCALKDNSFDKVTFRMIFRRIWDRYKDDEDVKGDLAESFEEEYARFMWSDDPDKPHYLLVADFNDQLQSYIQIDNFANC